MGQVDRAGLRWVGAAGGYVVGGLHLLENAPAVHSRWCCGRRLVIVFFPTTCAYRRASGAQVERGALLPARIFVILVPLTLLTFASSTRSAIRADAPAKQDGTAGGGRRRPGCRPKPPLPRAGRALARQYVDISGSARREFIAERLKGVSGATPSRTLGVVGGRSASSSRSSRHLHDVLTSSATASGCARRPTT